MKEQISKTELNDKGMQEALKAESRDLEAREAQLVADLDHFEKHKAEECQKLSVDAKEPADKTAHEPAAKGSCAQ